MPHRVDRLRERLAAENLDALLVSSRPNIRYLCGFSGSAAAFLVDREEAVLFTDSRYVMQAHEEVREAAVERTAGPPLRGALGAARRGTRTGFEADAVTVAEHEALVAAAAGRSLAPTTGLVEGLRAAKEPEELRMIEASVRLSADAFDVGLGAVGEGAEEVEVAAAIEHEMRRRGAAGPAFETIVASGPRGALPHARASRRRLRLGDAVVIDAGAHLDGYGSDMTRTVFVGEPDGRARDVYHAVLQALLRAEQTVREGVAAGEVADAARLAIVEAGFAEEAFQHGAGHGVGLEVHEAPRIARERRELLAAGMVVAIEPGVYVPGWGGVRIEDVVVVEEAGCRVLTPTAKEILSV